MEKDNTIPCCRYRKILSSSGAQAAQNNKEEIPNSNLALIAKQTAQGLHPRSHKSEAFYLISRGLTIGMKWVSD